MTIQKVENNILYKKSFLHAKGIHEVYTIDSRHQKQGLYSIFSRKTKMKLYECYYINDCKVGIENIYDINGNLKYTHYFN